MEEIKGPDAAVPSARWQQAEQFMAGVKGVFNDPVGLLPTPLGVEVLRGWQPCPSNVLSRIHRPLWSLTVQGGAAAIPGRDAASQDTLYGAPVEIAENPGIHVEPPQPAKE